MLRYKLSLAVLLVFIFIASADATVMLDRVVAVVNKEIITWSELYRTMETDASPQVKALSEEERRKVFKENEKDFLEILINMKLQLQEARNTGIKVTEEEINETIDGIKKKYSMKDPEFRESLKKEGYTYEEYRRRMEEQIILSKITGYVIKRKLLITDEDIEKYIAENRNSIDLAEGYRISQIFFRKPQNDEERKISEERMRLITGKLKEGESFSELARQYSEDASRKNGGELGFIRREDLGREFAEVVSKMKPGEVSSPFLTDKGLHILRLEEKMDKKDPVAIKEEVRKILGNKIFMDKYNEWIKLLREKSFIEIRL